MEKSSVYIENFQSYLASLPSNVWVELNKAINAYSPDGREDNWVEFDNRDAWNFILSKANISKEIKVNIERCLNGERPINTSYMTSNELGGSVKSSPINSSFGGPNWLFGWNDVDVREKIKNQPTQENEKIAIGKKLKDEFKAPIRKVEWD